VLVLDGAYSVFFLNMSFTGTFFLALVTNFAWYVVFLPVALFFSEGDQILFLSFLDGIQMIFLFSSTFGVFELMMTFRAFFSVL